MSGIVAQSAVTRFGRLRNVSGEPQGARAHGPGIGIARLGRNILEPALIAEGTNRSLAAAPESDAVGRERECLVIACDRLLVTLGGCERIADIAPSAGLIGARRERALGTRERPPFLLPIGHRHRRR